LRLLDTDTCIAILRGNAAVIERRAATDDDVATTWITVAELHYGAAKSRAPEKNRGLAKSFLATLPILGLDEASAQIFGEAKASLTPISSSAPSRLPTGRLSSPGPGAITSASRASRSRTGSEADIGGEAND
jgi:hypothetical protein